MKALGAVLLVGGGFWVRQTLLARRLEIIRWGQALCRLLDSLERGVMVLRRPLPVLLDACRREEALLGTFLGEILDGLSREEPFAPVWRRACRHAPACYRPLLEPLGDSLTDGRRGDLIILTREEIHRATEEERRLMGERDRLITALCLSGSLLAVVVLI